MALWMENSQSESSGQRGGPPLVPEVPAKGRDVKGGFSRVLEDDKAVNHSDILYPDVTCQSFDCSG